MRENASTSSGASIITRLMGDCVITTDWTGVNMDTFTRLRQMDIDSMKAQRPKVLFSSGDAMAYSLHFKAFQDATDLNTVTFSDKLAEMLHWFDGTAKSIIEQHKQDPRHDARTAYGLATKELDAYFKDNQNSIVSFLATICNGRQLGSNDLKGHEDLHSELRRFLLSARITNSLAEFHRQESHIVRSIVESRLGHLADDFLRRHQKVLRQNQKGLSYDDLMAEVSDWTAIIKSRKPEVKAPKAQRASVAAVATTAPQKGKNKSSYAKRLVESPPKEQPSKCTVCGRPHPSQECSVLAAIPLAEDRVTHLRGLSLCFHCFCNDHRANECRQKPVCKICSKRHATLLHDRVFPDSAQRPQRSQQSRASTMNPDALPFEQTAAAQPRQPASTTVNNQPPSSQTATL